MSISRHNVATLRRNLGITASAQGPDLDSLALQRKCGLAKLREAGHRISQRRFSPGVCYGTHVSPSYLQDSGAGIQVWR